MRYTASIMMLAFLLSACSDAVVSPSTDTGIETDVEGQLELADIQRALDMTQGVAEFQVIHNADDPKARNVDVYIDGMRAINNFHYRKATPFIPLPTEFEVAVAPQNSKSVDDAIATFPFADLMDGGKYLVVADGVLPSWRFGPTDGIGFNLYPYLVEDVDCPGVRLIAFHGVTDAPAVDVDARDVGNVFEGAEYGQFAEGCVPVGEYVLDLTTSGPDSVVVATFSADLSGLEGQTVTVLASGFLSPPPGPTLALVAVFEDGSRQIISPWDEDDDYDEDDEDEDEEYDDEEEDEDDDEEEYEEEDEEHDDD